MSTKIDYEVRDPISGKVIEITEDIERVRYFQNKNYDVVEQRTEEIRYRPKLLLQS